MAAMMLFGVTVFQSALAPAGLRLTLASPLLRLAAVSAVVAGMTTLAWLLLVASDVGDGDSMVGAVLFDTEFGQVWQFRLAILVAIGGAFALRDRAKWPALAILSALLLATSGLVGHAAMIEGPQGVLNRSSHVVHLLAAGFWIGALVPLLLATRRLGDRDQGREALLALRRFSLVGSFAVAAVVVRRTQYSTDPRLLAERPRISL